MGGPLTPARSPHGAAYNFGMPQPTVDGLVYLLDEAFEGRGLEESNESQALLTNLATVTDAEWRATVPGATAPYAALRQSTAVVRLQLRQGACTVTAVDDRLPHMVNFA